MASRFRTGWTTTLTVTPAAGAYSANDVFSVAQAMSWVDFNGVLFPGGELMITSARLQIAHTALVASEAGYNLHLYNVTPPSAHADNDPWDEPSGDRLAYLGFIALGTPVDIGSTLEVFTDGINRQISVAATGKTWGEVVTAAGITPTAAARKITLHAFSP